MTVATPDEPAILSEHDMRLPVRDSTELQGVIIPWAKPTLPEAARERVLEALDSSWISHGPFVRELEQRIAELCGVKYGIAVANGTVAIHLALLGLGLQPGDEVIVPGFTFVAVANMAISVGATPVYADVDPDTWCLDLTAVKDAITARTKVICVVNLYGNVGDLQALRDLADSHNIVLLEDNAESFGTMVHGRMAGSVGHLATLSFQATKTITTGEGGMVLTDSDALWEKMVLLRDHGMRKDRRYWHDVVGYNFRLTNLQAALGCTQLDVLDEIFENRRRIHKSYLDALKSCAGFVPQTYRQGVQPVLWAFAGRVEVNKGGSADLRQLRDHCIQELMRKGIETRPGFYAMSSLPPYDAPELEISSRLAASVISLPTYSDLTNEDIKYVCENFIEILSEASASQ
jgi:perosamine synthetase